MTLTPYQPNTPQQLSRQGALELVIKGLNSIRDGILRYYELGLTIKDLHADLETAGLGKSLKTLQNTQAQLRKEGLLPQPTQGARNDLNGSSRNQEPLMANLIPESTGFRSGSAPSGAVSVPTSTITHQPSSPEPLEPVRLSGVRELQPGEYTHQDYNEIIQLFEQINDLIYKHRFTDDFTAEEWISLRGSWQGVGVGIQAECDHIKRSESDREDAITVDVIVAT